jgi:hypothetical protein
MRDVVAKAPDVTIAVDPRPQLADGSNPSLKQPPEDSEASSDGVVRGPMRRTDIRTTPIDPKDIRASWPIVIAYLEQMSGWAVLALRLGTLALIQDCVKELAKPDADPDIVAGLRKLVDALAHMPMEA